jgi:hypothetical protein
MAFGIKSYGQSWLLNEDIDNYPVNITLYNDNSADPSFTDDDLSDLNPPLYITDTEITLSISSDSGSYEFSKSNISVDVDNVGYSYNVDAYAIYDPNNDRVILTGGTTSTTNIRYVSYYDIDEVGGSFL